MPGFARNENAGAFATNTDQAQHDGRAESARRYLFIHLMNTAGTSLAFQLQQQFQPHEVYPSKGFDSLDTDRAGYVSMSRLLRVSPERRAAIRIYTGHFPFVAAELLDEDLTTLTMLRDPVDRTFSVLKHLKRRSKRYHDHRLEEIYDDPFVFVHFIENHQTRMFAITADDKPEAFGGTMSYWATAALLGLGNPNDDPETPDPADRERAIATAKASAVDERRYEVAKQHLAKVDVIGFTEQYNEFIDELRRRFGWWPSGLDTKSKVNISPENWEEPATLRSRIAGDNAYDIEFYEYAKQLVNDRRRRTATPAAKVGPATAGVPARPAPVGKKSLRAEIRAKHPRFFEALVADARITSSFRSERTEFHGRFDALVRAIRLMCVSDAFLGQACYRAKARLQALGVPVLPWIAHRLAMMTAQICIGDPVVVQPGVYIAHGQVVLDGFVEIHRGVVIFPWVTIGLRAGDIRGPTIGRNVHIGTGAKIIGPVTVHRSARIGANAVVVDNVAAHTTVAGVPARPVRDVAPPR